MTIFIAIYLIALFCYFFTRTSENIKHRAINKYIMATMYLVLALITFFKKYDFVSYQTLLIAALILAWLGDIFLVFDFGRGGDFFLAGNICFALYEQIILVKHGHTIKETYWVFIAAALMALAFYLACTYMPETFKLGKMKGLITFYLCSIFTHGLNGLCMAILLPGTPYVMMGIGSFLFMISDMILMTYKFVLGSNKWLVRLNSLTYFLGLLFIVLSTTL